MFRGVKRHNIFLQICAVFEMFSFSKKSIALLLSINHVPKPLLKQIFKDEMKSNRKAKDESHLCSDSEVQPLQDQHQGGTTQALSQEGKFLGLGARG